MVGCTLIARNFAAHARVLAESFRRHHPEATFKVLVVDDPERQIGGEDFEVLTPPEIGVDEHDLNRRATMSTAQGLVSGLKASLLLHLAGAGEPVLYLDSDGCVYGDLSSVADLASQNSVVLSPHSLDPQPLRDGLTPERTILEWGVMNGGFLAVGDGAGSFLEWWHERAAHVHVADPEHPFALSQPWLSVVPAIFDHHVLRDPGCNAMGWRLRSSDVEWEGDVATIDGAPLRYFHFMGTFDPRSPGRLSSRENSEWLWPTLDQRPGAARLYRDYAQRLLANGYEEASAQAPLFDTMPGGRPIEPWMRVIYRHAVIAAQKGAGEQPPNPFSDGSEAFVQWAEQAASPEPSRARRVTRRLRRLALG